MIATTSETTITNPFVVTVYYRNQTVPRNFNTTSLEGALNISRSMTKDGTVRQVQISCILQILTISRT